MGRAVAVKVLRRSTRSEPRQVAEEAVLGSVSSHPHIVSIYASGSSEGRSYQVLAYADLGSMGDVGKLENDQVAEVALAVADALAHIHDRGFVHGDVKPANVLRDRAAGVLLADFGLASAEMSRTAGFSAAYASPALLGGSSPTPADDIWALGVTLYELAAGVLPFPSGGDSALAPSGSRTGSTRTIHSPIRGGTSSSSHSKHAVTRPRRPADCSRRRGTAH